MVLMMDHQDGDESSPWLTLVDKQSNILNKDDVYMMDRWALWSIIYLKISIYVFYFY